MSATTQTVKATVNQEWLIIIDTSRGSMGFDRLLASYVTGCYLHDQQRTTREDQLVESFLKAHGAPQRNAIRKILGKHKTAYGPNEWPTFAQPVNHPTRTVGHGPLLSSVAIVFSTEPSPHIIDIIYRRAIKFSEAEDFRLDDVRLVVQETVVKSRSLMPAPPAPQPAMTN